MRCNKTVFRRKGGFSYIWTLLLIAGLGISTVLSVEIAATAARRDKEKELLAIGRQFRAALARYLASSQNGGKPEYPESLEQLLRDDRLPGIRRHLRKIFIDPMTGKAQWGEIRIGGRIVGIHSLSEQMPIKQDGFEADSALFRGKQHYSKWVFTYPPDALILIESRIQPGIPP
ncbi:MAG: type II secretion system GspH family protein [Betaproteobacteria bacterium]|nr:type II secretion system GspH family protein [Betaproteobacteria bacterium]